MNGSTDELKSYGDEELWIVVQQHLAKFHDERLYGLIALGKQGQLTDQGNAEMERLIDKVDHSILLRSHALVLLKERGHKIEKQLNLSI